MEKRTTKPSGGRDNKELAVERVSDKEIKDLTKKFFKDDPEAVNPHFTINGFSQIGEVIIDDLTFKKAVMDETTFADGSYVERPIKTGRIDIKDSSSKESKKGKLPKKGDGKDKEEEQIK